jgi:predicted dehydrogenase/aryl-alcohol dehydrogenase-like predicted oxidoreductase
MSDTLNWGILGTGRIAGIFAAGVRTSRTGRMVAVGSRSLETAETFAAAWEISQAYASYEEVLADKEVQAVYIAIPHPWHAEWSIKAAEAGKHILCEKPLALNHAQAMTVVEAAVRHDVFLMEAYMYRCHPQMAKLVELIHEGAIGDVRIIQATFSFATDANPQSRLLNNALGGGGILDVGGYCTSIARLIAGTALGKEFVEPLQVKAVGHIGETGVDEYTVAALAFPGDIVADLWTGVRVQGENVVRVFGTKGSILILTPWLPSVGEPVHLVLQRGSERQVIPVGVGENQYGLEADEVAVHLAQRQSPKMLWEDSLGNIKTQDQWRAAVGVVYAVEKPDGPGQMLPIHQRPLNVRPSSQMKYGRIQGVEKPISRLVIGADNQTTWPHAAAMFDDFFERGGTCFDTAYTYGGGACECMLGQWIKNRGLREQVVMLDKGAHTPHCDPESLTRQHLQSLERLQTEYVDIYMLHRDNPAIPVGEFISVLNEHTNAGRMRVFGASNWSIERVVEANRWAAEHGMASFSAISNNFSLARMIDPVWAGCISASDAHSRAWLTDQQMPLMPWSSQARGFFTGRAHPEDHSDAELVRCWYSEDNFQRLERVSELARQRGVLPISVALAYVLCQPFPTFPLIGPRQLSETRTSFQGLEVELTSEDLRWLNLEE